jgi:hypothetical protein
LHSLKIDFSLRPEANREEFFGSFSSSNAAIIYVTKNEGGEVMS